MGRRDTSPSKGGGVHDHQEGGYMTIREGVHDHQEGGYMTIREEGT